MNVGSPNSLLWGIVFRQPLTPTQGRRLLSQLRRRFTREGLIPLTRHVPSTPGQSLTPRQRDVLREMVAGKGTKEIGRTLGISTKTVETHRQNLMARLAIDDLPGLVRYALQSGLVPAPWLAGEP
jgi:DNA-binding NarL/FixJ family response regulator